MIIIITEKPEQGKVNRVCRICGEPYIGWNYVQCGKHPRNYTVSETWRLIGADRRIPGSLPSY